MSSLIDIKYEYNIITITEMNDESILLTLFIKNNILFLRFTDIDDK